VIAVAVICTLVRVITEVIERIRISAENSFFQKEMSLARMVQFALIPNDPPQIDGHNADGWTLPADMTGGDLFDLWKLPDGRMGLLVADASGHGLAPAMIVSQVRTLVHMLSEYETHPHTLLQRVNARLALDLEAGRFVTAFLAFISSDGKVDWASAGHGPMFWSPTPDGQIQELSSSGLPLGVQEDWFADEPSPPLQLEENGRLIVVSDGIFEAHSPNRKLWGTDPIKDILHKSPLASSKEIIERFAPPSRRGNRKTEPVDDQTIVVVRRTGTSHCRCRLPCLPYLQGTLMKTYIIPALLLLVSNTFMTTAWYGHLKFEKTALWIVILVSWGIAFLSIASRSPPTASATCTGCRRGN
jgi:serine phosphatase RsbU (regulator of sigma subunit)